LVAFGVTSCAQNLSRWGGLVDGIRPERCEHVWAEPYNDRLKWEGVRAVYDEGSAMWEWMPRVFGERGKALWSRYTTDLYTRIHRKAVTDGWANKLLYLLYEGDITRQDAASFHGLDGVLLQSPPVPMVKAKTLISLNCNWARSHRTRSSLIL